MHKRWILAFSLFAISQLAISHLQKRKQKRMIELIDRQFADRLKVQDRDITGRHEFISMESLRRSDNDRKGLPEDVKRKAMRDLLEIFDVPKPVMVSSEARPLRKIKRPPRYMVDLYNTIADRHGITRAPGLLNVDTVRSIPNIYKSCPRHCFFDIRPFDKKEILMDAELHVYIDKPFVAKESKRTTTYFVKIYQRLDEVESQKKLRRTLVAARRLPLHVYGWQILPLLTTVEHWITKKKTNFGIVIESSTKMEHSFAQTSLAKGKQPILVVFSNNSETLPNFRHATTVQVEDHQRAEFSTSYLKRYKRSVDGTMKRARSNQMGRNLNPTGNRVSKEPKSTDHHEEMSEQRVTEERNPNYNSNYSYFSPANESRDYVSEADGKASQYDIEYVPQNNLKTSGSPSSSVISRQQRRSSPAGFTSFSTLSTGASTPRACRRYPLYVDFEEMGWSGWIIHPKGYNAYHCRGMCAFPLSQNFKPSNHATVQSIMHTLGLGGQPVDMPSCTPDKLYDINLLYFDHNDYVVLRRYKDMVAASCACR